MRATDDGLWREVVEADYRAFLRDHPRRASLQVQHQSVDRGDWWFVFDRDAYAASGQHTKDPSLFKVAYRVEETGKPMRFWIPAG